MARESPQDGPPGVASGAIESFVINLLTILLKKGVIQPEEAGTLIAGVKSEIRALASTSAEERRAELLMRRLDDLAHSLKVTKPN
jgi:hypothetical protein